MLGRRVENPLLVAQNRISGQRFRTRERGFLGLAVLCLGLAVYALAHVSTLDPERSVEDPAIILVVLFGLSSVQAFIAYLRQRPTENI
ncbi:MAG: hypothetical protein H0T74_15405 [Rubrobacteraceae bacterium]|nr:hypothetical protein [Rubrobacteraceae bacterium]